MSKQKAISSRHKSSSYFYNGNVELDLDRLIDYMDSEVKRIETDLANPKGTMFEDKLIADFMENHKDSYEGLLGMIMANEFK